ncbi:hypothetical protein [Uliginosibacterium sp. H1]|uniref:hypothetical protein n=1 Tax=Uliginosibacterium sp. H1 TaxID=3114757 RepID=UPI002E16DDAD|nr:hypothetical protein [Uliginosibacterium sp. H1]
MKTVAVAALALTALATAPAHAQTKAADPDAWHWEAAIYLYLPVVSGSTSFPTGGGGSNIDVGPVDYTDALQAAFMGQIEARKGRWGAWSDLVYYSFQGDRLGASDFTVGRRTISTSSELSVGLDATIWTIAGTYALQAPANLPTSLVFGTRMLNISETLDWRFDSSVPQLSGTSSSSSARQINWDAVVGVKGQYRFGNNQRWSMPYYADVGTGESRLTWQLSAGLGYRFGWGTLFGSWRHIAYEMKSGNAVETLEASGPLLGASFQW